MQATGSAIDSWEKRWGTEAGRDSGGSACSVSASSIVSSPQLVRGRLRMRRCSAASMVRRTRGDDIDAACGQLKGQVLDRTRRQSEFKRKLEAQGISDAAA